MCIFCKIAKKEIPSEVVIETDDVLAFRDLNPQAPTHVLVIPKKHLASMNDATEADRALLGNVMLTARAVADKLGLMEKGYRLVVNNGQEAGQSVFHLHLHVLAGRPMGWPPG